MKPLGKNQQKYNATAFSLIELLVIIAILGILAALLFPAFSRPHGAKLSRCVMNIKQIGLAFQMWARDNSDKYPISDSIPNGDTAKSVLCGNVFSFFQSMSNELNVPKILVCPADTAQVADSIYTTRFSAKNVSYFAGLDANTSHPQAFLSGDANFEVSGVPVKSGLFEFSTNAPISWTAKRHKFVGNVGLADGSVQQVGSSGLRQWLLPQTGLATNRLLLP